MKKIKGYWITTDGLIINFNNVLLMKDNTGADRTTGLVRVVFIGGINEENIIDEDLPIFDAYRQWLDNKDD